MNKTVMSLERHFLDQQRRYPEARGDFTKLLTEIAFAAKIVSREVNRAGLAGILGQAGRTNVQGEEVQKLDILAHNIMVRSMNHLGLLCALSSEEAEEVIRIPNEYPVGNYALNMDPLDGSSNIDVNVSIGTIFSIHRKVSYAPGAMSPTAFNRGTSRWLQDMSCMDHRRCWSIHPDRAFLALHLNRPSVNSFYLIRISAFHRKVSTTASTKPTSTDGLMPCANTLPLQKQLPPTEVAGWDTGTSDPSLLIFTEICSKAESFYIRLTAKHPMVN